MTKQRKEGSANERTYNEVKILQGLVGDIENNINTWTRDNNIDKFTVSISPFMHGAIAAITYEVTESSE